jgi:hypothetical protein
MISFFVEGKEIEGIKETLKILKLPVRSKGFAHPEEVAFFFNPEKKGFCFNAYKFEESEIPDVVCASPFLVSVGKDWAVDGLFYIIRQYNEFFFRGIPFLDPEMDEDALVEVCRNCITLPWGGFPQTKEGEIKLAKWISRVNKILFPLEFQSASKLTDLW